MYQLGQGESFPECSLVVTLGSLCRIVVAGSPDAKVRWTAPATHSWDWIAMYPETARPCVLVSARLHAPVTSSLGAHSRSAVCLLLLTALWLFTVACVAQDGSCMYTYTTSQYIDEGMAAGETLTLLVLHQQLCKLARVRCVLMLSVACVAGTLTFAQDSNAVSAVLTHWESWCSSRSNFSGSCRGLLLRLLPDRQHHCRRLAASLSRQ